MAKVIVTITKEGKTTVEAEGWTGPTCATVTSPYHRKLGKATTDAPKPEFYEEETHITQDQQVS